MAIDRGRRERRRRGRQPGERDARLVDGAIQIPVHPRARSCGRRRRGGISRDVSKRLFSYLFTTARPDTIATSAELLDYGQRAPMAGLGYGLPISRTYARYFGGEVTVMKARQTANEPTAPFAPAPIDEVVAAIHRESPEIVFAPHVETSAGVILPDDYIKRACAAMEKEGGLL